MSATQIKHGGSRYDHNGGAIKKAPRKQTRQTLSTEGHTPIPGANTNDIKRLPQPGNVGLVSKGKWVEFPSKKARKR